jgi:hypothetical protein
LNDLLLRDCSPVGCAVALISGLGNAKMFSTDHAADLAG